MSDFAKDANVSYEDTISRQAAIEIVDRYNKSHMILQGKPMLGAASIVIELEALPSAQPEPHWIPCSERLPEEEDMYKRPQNRYICQMDQAGIFLVLARLRHLGSPMAAFWD